MGALGFVFVVLYVAGIIGLIVFVLVLFYQLVKAQQRCAGALDAIARRLAHVDENS
jgi:hypothetical protein